MRFVNLFTHLAIVALLLIETHGNGALALPEPSGEMQKPVCVIKNRNHMSAVLFLPTEERLLLAGGDYSGPGELIGCKATALKPAFVRKDFRFPIQVIAATANGKRVAAGGNFGQLKVYDAVSGDLLTNLDNKDGQYISAVTFSADGRLLAAAAAESITVWDAESWKELFSVPFVLTSPHGIAFSPDNKLLAFGGVDKIRFWDVREQHEAFTIRSTGGDKTLLFTLDGKGVIVSAAGVDDCAELVRFIDLEKKKETGTLKGHRIMAVSLALDKEGQYLVTASNDGTVRVWGLANGEELVRLSLRKEIVQGLAVSNENKYLAACSDKMIRVWNLRKLLKSAKSRPMYE